MGPYDDEMYLASLGEVKAMEEDLVSGHTASTEVSELSLEPASEPDHIDWSVGIIARSDGSFVVTKHNSPYHIPMNAEEFTAEFARVTAFVAANPDMVLPEPLPDPPSLEELRKEKIAVIDAQTSAAILAGFDYEIDTGNHLELLHFSYDVFDQQNFVDTANVASLVLSGTPGLPQGVIWNAYRNWTSQNGGELVRLTLDPVGFLNLYTGGALVHKAMQMEIGGQRKAAAIAAITPEDLEMI